jgi:hypothetical protein
VLLKGKAASRPQSRECKPFAPPLTADARRAPRNTFRAGTLSGAGAESGDRYFDPTWDIELLQAKISLQKCTKL